MRSNHKYNILVVDDEITKGEILQSIFLNDYQVFVSTSPTKALKIFKENKIQLVIADLYMPEMSGIELLEKIKDISPHPIRIVLGANTDIECMTDAIDYGLLYRYVIKPWEPDELKMVVRNALEYYQSNVDRLGLIEELEKKTIELDNQNKSLNSALKKLEENQSKLIELERFSFMGKMAGMILHDLKQPIDIIRSAAETMTRTELKEDERFDVIEIIRFEIERFLEMIQQILDFSRESFSLNMKEIWVSDFSGITENRIRNYLLNYKINFRFEPGQGDGIIRVDRNQLHRAILNLVRNAVEAFEKTGDVVQPVITFRTQFENRKVQFIVEDNGPGIQKNISHKIFTPFFSGKKSAGIGMGLTIVKHIIEQHKGHVEYKPNSPRGAIFSLILKLEENSNDLFS